MVVVVMVMMAHWGFGRSRCSTQQISRRRPMEAAQSSGFFISLLAVMMVTGRKG
jgi:hypothetical protein